MNKLQIYCVTNERVKYLEDTKLVLAGVGKKNLVKITPHVLKEKIFNIKKGIIQSSPFIIGFGKIN